MLGCGGSAPPEVPRKLEGEVVQGPFVSPYSYEWVVRAERHMTLGAFEAAVLAFQRARSSAEEDPWLFARLVHAQACAGQLQIAKDTLAQALEMFPNQLWLLQEQAFVAEIEPILAQGSDREAAAVSVDCRTYFGDERPDSL